MTSELVRFDLGQEAFGIVLTVERPCVFST
jgi:hypothetical protein